MSLITWTISFVMIVPIVLYANTQQTNVPWNNNSLSNSSDLVVQAGNWSSSNVTGPLSCNIFWPENGLMNSQMAFTLYTFTLAFAIPLILILIFYILVIRKLQVGLLFVEIWIIANIFERFLNDCNCFERRLLDLVTSRRRRRGRTARLPGSFLPLSRFTSSVGCPTGFLRFDFYVFALHWNNWSTKSLNPSLNEVLAFYCKLARLPTWSWRFC